MKRTALSFALLLLAPLAALRTAEKPATASQPNIIVVVTDDQGYGELSCHGNPVLKTPHLDRLHAESIRYLAMIGNRTPPPNTLT
jgi:hypothetical protein